MTDENMIIKNMMNKKSDDNNKDNLPTYTNSKNVYILGDSVEWKLKKDGN